MRAVGTALYLVRVRTLCFRQLGHSFVRNGSAALQRAAVHDAQMKVTSPMLQIEITP